MLSRNRLYPSVRHRAAILGTEKTTVRMTPAQMEGQNALDRSFGFPLTQRPMPARVPVAPGTGGIAVRATGNSSALEAAGASALRQPSPAIEQVAYRPTPSAAYSPLSSNVYSAPIQPVPVEMTTPPGGPAATAASNPTPIPGATPPMLTNPSNALPTPTPAATPTLQPTPGAGRLAAAGVSNSQAAQFEQPTSKNPLPKTPTTPMMNVDDYDRRKKFTGF